MNQIIRVAVVLAGVAVLAWFGKEQFGGTTEMETGSERTGEPTQPSPSPTTQTPPSPTAPAPTRKPATAKQGAFTVLRGARLAKHRGNDGDSFHVTHGGKNYEFRLYFVDAPESRFKTYRGGKNNGERLDDQARYFGMTDRDRVASIGRDAKAFTLSKLSTKFSVFTTFEAVFGGDRSYAFVRPNGTGDFLHEQLVDRGLARIHTKGVDRPDGIIRRRAKESLKKREADAKARRVGGWK